MPEVSTPSTNSLCDRFVDDLWALTRFDTSIWAAKRCSIARKPLSTYASRLDQPGDPEASSTVSPEINTTGCISDVSKLGKREVIRAFTDPAKTRLGRKQQLTILGC